MQMAACVFLVLLGMGKPVSCQFDTVVILNDMPGEDLQTDCHPAGSFATLKWYNVKFHIVDSFVSEWSCCEMPTIEFVWFLLLYTSTHRWTIPQRYVYEPLLYDHRFEGLSWKWTNNVLTIFHLKSVFFVFCLQMPQMQVGLSWCSPDFLVGAQVLKDRSHVL
jgi:hypothetical protein